VGQHSPAAARAEIDVVADEVAQTILPTAWRLRIRRGRRGEQITAERQLGSAVTVGEKSDVADPVEAIGHGVLQENATSKHRVFRLKQRHQRFERDRRRRTILGGTILVSWLIRRRSHGKLDSYLAASSQYLSPQIDQPGQLPFLLSPGEP